MERKSRVGERIKSIRKSVFDQSSRMSLRLLQSASQRLTMSSKDKLDWKKRTKNGMVASEIGEELCFSSDCKTGVFYFFGDFGAKNLSMQKTMKTLTKDVHKTKSPQAVVMLGDNFYPVRSLEKILLFCLNSCRVERSGVRVRQPLGRYLQSNVPNESLSHALLCSLGKS